MPKTAKAVKKNKKQKIKTENDDDLILLEAFNYIKTGLQNGDWDSISIGYELITGEKIIPPQEETKPLLSKLEKLKLGLSSGKKIKQKSDVEKATVIKIGGGRNDKQLMNSENTNDQKRIEALIPDWGRSKEKLIITSQEDIKEKKANELAAKKVIKIKPTRRTSPVKTEPELQENDNRSCRYIDDVTKIHRNRE